MTFEEYTHLRAGEKAEDILSDTEEKRRERLLNVGWFSEKLPSFYQLRILVEAKVISEMSKEN